MKTGLVATSFMDGPLCLLSSSSLQHNFFNGCSGLEVIIEVSRPYKVVVSYLFFVLCST